MEDTRVLHLTEVEENQLTLKFCGTSVCRPGHSMGPSIRNNYVLHFITSGNGFFTVNDRTYTLTAQQGFLISPDTLTYYQADSDDPWSYFWIGFNGDASKTLLNNLGLNQLSPIFRYSNNNYLQYCIHEMLQCNVSTYTNQLQLHGLLYLFLSKLTDSIAICNMDMDMYDDNNYIKSTITFIQENYYKDIKIQDIADAICLNRSYLSSLFQKRMHQSLQHYLMNYRISRAEEMLILTDLPIKEVANSCGYEDTLTFSKAFKRSKQLTPSQYRASERKIYKVPGQSGGYSVTY